MPQPSSVPRVLFVEDDATIRDSVVEALTDSGYAVRGLPDGDELEAALVDFSPDAVLLDCMLPGRDGLELARRVRHFGGAAIIALTARNELGDRLTGFDAGVDDYLGKPFAMAELDARLRAVLRRTGKISNVLEVGDLVIDEAALTVTRAGAPVELTATELRLLIYLAHNRGRIVSSVQILTQVWGYDDYAENLVQVHLSALRRKLEEHGPRMIETRRGLGYVLRVPRADPAAAAR